MVDKNVTEINDLPNECLLQIFQLVDCLDDLLHCYQVCNRWRDLIAYRLRQVEYLTDDRGYDSPPDAIQFNNLDDSKAFDLASLLPKVKILDIYHPFQSYPECVFLSSSLQSIRGLIHEDHPKVHPFISGYCDNLELLATDSVKYFFHDTRWTTISGLTQLFSSEFEYGELEKLRIAKYCPSLRRLHIETSYVSLNKRYRGPKFDKLEILEYSALSITRKHRESYYTGFSLLDFCPNVKSAFFYADTDKFVRDTHLKNHSLRDLVIEQESFGATFAWSELRAIIYKFPNLECLAIRNNDRFNDESIPKLIQALPKLKLLEMRNCPMITLKSAEFIQNLCKESNRRIKFYFKPQDVQILENDLKLKTKKEKVCQEFDFIKNCFGKKFQDLPYFL